MSNSCNKDSKDSKNSKDSKVSKDDGEKNSKDCLYEEQENKVFAEILWGTNIRLDRIQEKKQEKIDKEEVKRRRRRSKKYKPKSKMLCYCPGTLAQLDYYNDCNEIIDRRTLTRREHTKLLATPKCQRICIHEVCLPKKYTIKRTNIENSIPPRFHLLSLPKARQVLHTWTKFQYYMNAEKLLYIRELLKKIDSLTTKDANKYFNKLNSLQKKHLRKAKGRPENSFICRGRNRSKRDIDRFVDRVMNYFYKKPFGQVKYRHTVITSEIIEKITHKSLCAVFNRCSKHPYSVTLFDFVDQVSIWIDQKVSQMDLIDLSEGIDDESLTITVSGTDSSATDSSALYSVGRGKHKGNKDDESEEGELYGESEIDSVTGKRKSKKGRNVSYPDYCEDEGMKDRYGKRGKGKYRKRGTASDAESEYEYGKRRKKGKSKKGIGSGEEDYEIGPDGKKKLKSKMEYYEDGEGGDSVKLRRGTDRESEMESEGAHTKQDMALQEIEQKLNSGQPLTDDEKATLQQTLIDRLAAGEDLSEEEQKLLTQVLQEKFDSGKELTEDEKKVMEEMLLDKLHSGQPLTDKESQALQKMFMQKLESGEPMTEEEKALLTQLSLQNVGEPMTKQQEKLVEEMLANKLKQGISLTDEEKKLMTDLIEKKMNSGEPLTDEEKKVMEDTLVEKLHSGEPLTDEEKQALQKLYQQKLESGEPMTDEQKQLMTEISLEQGETMSKEEEKLIEDTLSNKLKNGEPLSDKETEMMEQILKDKLQSGEPLTEEENSLMQQILMDKLNSGAPLSEEEKALMSQLSKDEEAKLSHAEKESLAKGAEETLMDKFKSGGESTEEKQVMQQALMDKLKSGEPLTDEEKALLVELSLANMVAGQPISEEDAKLAENMLMEKIKSGKPLTDEDKKLLNEIQLEKMKRGEPLGEEERKMMEDVLLDKLHSGGPLTDDEKLIMQQVLLDKMKSGEPLSDEQKKLLAQVALANIDSGIPMTKEELKLAEQMLTDKLNSGEPLSEEDQKLLTKIKLEKMKLGEPLNDEEKEIIEQRMMDILHSGQPLSDDEKTLMQQVLMDRLNTGAPLTDEEKALLIQLQMDSINSENPLSPDERNNLEDMLLKKMEAGSPLSDEEKMLMAEIVRQKAVAGEPLTEDEKALMNQMNQDLVNKLTSGVPLSEQEQALLDRLNKEAEWEKEKGKLETQMQQLGEAEEVCSLVPLVEAEKTVIGVGREICKPPTVTEHSPDLICCLTLKIWAAWILEVAHNTQTWCKWTTETIGQIRLYAAILKGEVKNVDGTVKILSREEWNDFKLKMEQDKISFLQYNMHVQELSDDIIKNFHGKRVACCPYCLQEKMILSVDQGHEVTQQLTEAIVTSSYWRRWLKNLIEHADKLAAIPLDECVCGAIDTGIGSTVMSSQESSIYEIIELSPPRVPSQGNKRGKTQDQGTATSSCGSELHIFEEYKPQ